MALFEEIVSYVLNEDVGINKINDAINNTYEVKISYHSETDNATGQRIIQPVAYGLTKAGKPVIRAYQPFGDTQTSIPSWKFFLVSGIRYWKPLRNNKFTKPNGDFNPNGDKTMSVVFNIADFGETQIQKVSQQPKPLKASGPVKKQDIIDKKEITINDNPEVQKLKKLLKQLQNPKYISDLANNPVEVQKLKNIRKQLDNPQYISDIIKKPNEISVQDNPEIQKLQGLRKQLENPTYISDLVKNKTFGQESPQEDNNQHMVANSGPVEKTNITQSDVHKTQSEQDIDSRREQFNKNERISQDLLNQWQKEQEKRKNKKNVNRK